MKEVLQVDNSNIVDETSSQTETEQIDSMWERFWDEAWLSNGEHLPRDFGSDQPVDFMRSLITVTNRHETEPERLASFLSKVQETYFSQHPSVFSYCPLGEGLLLAAQANRNELIRGYFGQTLVGDITYRLSFLQEDAMEDLMTGWVGMSLGDKLDVINFLQTVGADAVSEGQWARPARERVEGIINHLADAGKIPYLDYVRQLALARLQAENNDPSLSVVTYVGNESAGRLDEALPEQYWEDDKILGHQYNFQPPVSTPHHLIKGAQNVVVELDRSNQPVRYGYLPHEQPISHSTLDGRTILPYRLSLEMETVILLAKLAHRSNYLTNM